MYNAASIIWAELEGQKGGTIGGDRRVDYVIRENTNTNEGNRDNGTLTKMDTGDDYWIGIAHQSLLALSLWDGVPWRFS